MPSNRRIRIFGVAVFSAVIYILYLTSNARHTRSPDFYSKTKDALDRNKNTHHPHSPYKGSAIDDEAVEVNLANGLKDAEQEAKVLAEQKSSKPESLNAHEQKAKAVVEDINSDKPMPEKKAVDMKKQDVVDDATKDVEKDDRVEDQEVKLDLERIFKRSPIIIFSKSYCPHSKRAKDILLNKYNIVPAPYVVELDQHPKGAALQAKLAAMTKRTTVPNVMIRGKSIGGGDDIAELDHSMKLIKKIMELGGKQMQLVEERTK